MKTQKLHQGLLNLILILVLVPVLGGVFCECAYAAPSDTVQFQRVPCRGCCPENIAAPESCAVLTDSRPFAISSSKANWDLLSGWTKSLDAIPVQNEKTTAPDISPGALVSSNPLYLLNLVLRF